MRLVQRTGGWIFSPWIASCDTREFPQLRGFAAGNLSEIARYPGAEAELSRSETIQSDIWKQAWEASRLPDHDPDAVKLLVPSLNDMFDAASTRTTSRMMHPPMAIFALLFSLALVCSLLAGYALAGGKQRSWLHIAAFAIVYVISVYVILEIEARSRKTVRLNGVKHEIDSEKITRLAARLEPKGIDEYWVKIRGRKLPPKQVVSELLNVPLVDFTKMDATRILADEYPC